MRDGREQFEKREVRQDTFETEDVDDFRRELLDTELSPRTVQKILVLLHGVFKLARRRKLIQANPSEDAERVALEDAGVFNVLEPAEFELVYRAVLGEVDKRPEKEGEEEDDDAIDALSDDDRQLYGAALSTSFYAGLRMGEKRDLPWRNLDAARSMIRVESGFTHGSRSTPKGKRARSTPLVDVLADRLAALRKRSNFTGAPSPMEAHVRRTASAGHGRDAHPVSSALRSGAWLTGPRSLASDLRGCRPKPGSCLRYAAPRSRAHLVAGPDGSG